MEYVDYLKKQPADKDAIIVNGDCYTYGMLYARVQEERKHLPQVEKNICIPFAREKYCNS